MSQGLLDQVDVEDLIGRYEELLNDLDKRLSGAKGADDAKQVKRLELAIERHRETIAQKLDGLRIAVGDAVHTGTGSCGTVAAVDGAAIEIRVAEQVIPEEVIHEHVIPEHTVKAFWHEDFEGWIDDEDEEEWFRE